LEAWLLGLCREDEVGPGRREKDYLEGKGGEVVEENQDKADD